MKLNAIAPWLGAKRTMAPDIVAELGKHTAYFEPCCGSCAVLFGKPPSSMETVNDLHRDLVNLARVLQSKKAEPLYAKVARTLHCDALQREARGRLSMPCPVGKLITHHHIDRAYYYLVASWQGRNGTAGCPCYTSGTSSVRWTPNGGSSATRWASVAESIPWWHQRLRNVVILSRDACEVLDKIEDDERTAIYVDPPYFIETRGAGNGSRYEHDFTGADHERLAESLGRFRRARVVVSYYADPRLESLYPARRWTLRHIDAVKNLSVQAKRKSTAVVAPEVLLINGPSYTNMLQPTLF